MGIKETLALAKNRGIPYSLYRGWKNFFKASGAPVQRKGRQLHVRDPNSTSYQCILKPDEVTPSRIVPGFIKKPPYILKGIVDFDESSIEIKTPEQIEGMRKSCQLARQILDKAASQLEVGITTDYIDKIVHQECIKNDCYPSPLLYKGFPKSVCTSINNVACHGIPDLRPLYNGDIINIDITVYYNGYHGDVSETYMIGKVDDQGKRLVNIAKKCLDAGVSVCKPGRKFSELGAIISETAENEGFRVIPNICGHGIGSYFHGPPNIIHIEIEEIQGNQMMEEGMTFTIEPAVSEGHFEIVILEDGWTAVSIDNSRSAQFEHTVLVTSDGVEILTAKS